MSSPATAGREGPAPFTPRPPAETAAPAPRADAGCRTARAAPGQKGAFPFRPAGRAPPAAAASAPRGPQRLHLRFPARRGMRLEKFSGSA